VEIHTEDDRCRVLSAFSVFGPGEEEQPWGNSAEGWSIETPEGSVRVLPEEDRLTVKNAATGQAWQIRLRSP
jgi:hypothetical protein